MICIRHSIFNNTWYGDVELHSNGTEALVGADNAGVGTRVGGTTFQLDFRESTGSAHSLV